MAEDSKRRLGKPRSGASRRSYLPARSAANPFLVFLPNGHGVCATPNDEKSHRLAVSFAPPNIGMAHAVPPYALREGLCLVERHEQQEAAREFQ
jgi:hypothetical protein